MKMKRRSKPFVAWVKKYSDDLLFVAGCFAILIGSYRIDPTLAWFVCGVEFLVAGIVVAWSKRK